MTVSAPSLSDRYGPELLFAFQIQRQHRVNGLVLANDHPPDFIVNGVQPDEG